MKCGGKSEHSAQDTDNIQLDQSNPQILLSSSVSAVPPPGSWLGLLGASSDEKSGPHSPAVPGPAPAVPGMPSGGVAG